MIGTRVSLYIKCGSYLLVELMYSFIRNVVCECNFARGKKLNKTLKTLKPLFLCFCPNKESFLFYFINLFFFFGSRFTTLPVILVSALCVSHPIEMATASPVGCSGVK